MPTTIVGATGINKIQDGTVVDADIDTLAASKLTGALPALNGANLTSLTAANIAGALPAISGANLTNLPVQTTDISGKLNLAGGTMTGNLNITKASASAILTSTGSGNDASVLFATPSNARGMYLDDSDSNKLKFYTGHGKGTAGKEITFDNDGKVGIGTTSPTAPLHIQNAPGNNTTDSLYIYSTNGAAQLRMEGGGDEWIFNTNYNQNQLDIKNKSGSGSTNTRVSILSGGDVTIGAGNLVIGTSGKGIDFSVTSNTSAPLASMSNELLDDYEEGSWSPYITTNGGVYTTTSRGMSGFYTKIGRQVTCHWSASITTPTGGSGAVRLNNFPFAAANANHTPTTSMQWGRTTLAGSPMYGMMGGNSSQMWFEYSNSNGNPTQMPAGAMNQTTPYHNGQVTYYVD